MIWGEKFFFTKMSDNEKSIAYNLGVNVFLQGNFSLCCGLP